MKRLALAYSDFMRPFDGRDFVFTRVLRDCYDVQVADDPRFSQQAFVQAKALSIGAEVWPLIARKELQINSIRLDEPKISLVKNTAGKWNFESLGAKNERKQSSQPGCPPGGKGVLARLVWRVLLPQRWSSQAASSPWRPAVKRITSPDAE